MLNNYILQYEEGLWKDWEEMGLSNSTILVEEEQCKRLIQELPVNLVKEKPNIPWEDIDQFSAVVNACSPDTIMKFRADLRLYMELCKLDHTAPFLFFFLITEDYKFF